MEEKPSVAEPLCRSRARLRVQDFEILGSGFRVSGLKGFWLRVRGLGFRILKFWVQGFGFLVLGSGVEGFWFRVWGLGFRVEGLGFRV